MTLIKRFIAWWNSLCIFHSWGKWEQYTETGRVYPGLLGKHIPAEGVPYTEKRQKRKCLHCGKMEDRLL